MRKNQRLQTIEQLDITELEDLNAPEGYSYIYAFTYPEIIIVSSKKDDAFKILDFKFIKTTWIANAIYALIHKFNKTEIKIIEGTTIICITAKMTLTDIFNLLISLDRETL